MRSTLSHAPLGAPPSTQPPTMSSPRASARRLFSRKSFGMRACASRRMIASPVAAASATLMPLASQRLGLSSTFTSNGVALAKSSMIARVASVDALSTSSASICSCGIVCASRSSSSAPRLPAALYATTIKLIFIIITHRLCQDGERITPGYRPGCARGRWQGPPGRRRRRASGTQMRARAFWPGGCPVARPGRTARRGSPTRPAAG